MKSSFKALIFSAILIFFGALSCGDDEGDELSKEGPFNISELAGNWNATYAKFTGNNSSIDVIDDGGTVTMAVQSSGKFNLTINPKDRSSYVVGGEMFWELWEGNYYFAIAWNDYPDDWDTYGATLENNILNINGGWDSGEYDFDGDGTFESASINFTFEKI